MAGIRTNQIADAQITSAKIAELTAKIQYDTLTAEGTFSDNRDIVSKKYVDDQILANIEGLDVKQSVRAATTEVDNLQGVHTGTGVGAYIESFDPAFGDLTIDSVALASGDRVLVKDQGGAIFDTSPWSAPSGGNYRFTDTSEYGKFFGLTLFDGTEYYVWFNDGTGADPAGAPTPANQPNVGATGIEVDISAAVTAEDVAIAIKAAIDAGGLLIVRHADRLYFIFYTQTTGNDVALVQDGNGAGSVVAAPLSLVITNTVVGEPDVTIGRKNGVYVYTGTSGNTIPWRLTRATDFDENSEVTANAFMWVSEGTTYEDTGWVLISDDPLAVDTDGLAFAQFNGAGAITAGDALQKTGNTLDVLYDNQTIGLNGSNQLRVNEDGIKGEHITNSAFNGGFVGGLYLHDGPVQPTYLNATNIKPQFAASVDLSAAPSPAFEHGETLAFTGGGTGVFMAYEATGPSGHRMYYIPTNATAPTTGAVTGGIAGAGSVDGSPNDQRANTPDGATTVFDLSIATYNTQESPATPASVQEGSATVYRNGVLQKYVANDLLLQSGPDVVYTDVSAGTIEFSTAPAYGEEIQVRYIVREADGA